MERSLRAKPNFGENMARKNEGFCQGWRSRRGQLKPKPNKNMNRMKLFAAIAMSAASLATPLIVRADGTNTMTSATKPTRYPLKTCVVSGEKLGEMGAPIEFVYTNNGANQEIKFCCPMCKGRFLKDADTYMKTIKAAEDTK